jgi:hypothetical protein
MLCVLLRITLFAPRAACCCDLRRPARATSLLSSTSELVLVLVVVSWNLVIGMAFTRSRNVCSIGRVCAAHSQSWMPWKQGHDTCWRL